MRVLLLAKHLNIGGVTVYTINLARGLRKKGIDVWVGSSGGELVRKLKESGIDHVTFNLKTKFEFSPFLAPVYIRLKKFILENKIDIIHSQTRVTQVLAHFLSRSTGVKHVSTCHGFFRRGRLGRRIVEGWGDKVIAISDAVREHLIRDFRIDKKRVALIYNGVDAGEFSGEFSEEVKRELKNNLGFSRSPVIGSISRLSPVKGLNYLFYAMKDILSELPEARLLLVGEGPSKDYLKNLAKNLGIESNVFFAQSTTDTGRFLSIIDVFVFYSLEEGLGLALLEAMAAGRPCVGANVGGVSSIIEDGVTGLLVTPKDAHSLKESILRLLKDRPLRQKMSESGRRLVETKFSLDKMIKEVTGVYESALKS